MKNIRKENQAIYRKKEALAKIHGCCIHLRNGIYYGEPVHKVKTRLMLFCLAMLLLAAIAGLLVFRDENDVVKYYPHKLLEACPRLPISPSEKTNGVIAKFEIGNIQVDTLMEWYKNRGFSTVADSSQTNGYGANGISFNILTINQALTLVITHWEDS